MHFIRTKCTFTALIDVYHTTHLLPLYLVLVVEIVYSGRCTWHAVDLTSAGKGDLLRSSSNNWEVWNVWRNVAELSAQVAIQGTADPDLVAASSFLLAAANRQIRSTNWDVDFLAAQQALRRFASL